MRIYYYNKTILEIPAKIINYKFHKQPLGSGITFQLSRKLTYDDKAILYNTDEISELRISISNDHNFTFVDNYIHKYNLIKDDKNIYYLEKNKINTFSKYSKILSTCWFIGEL